MQKGTKVYQSLEIEVCHIASYNNAPANYESWSLDNKAAAERVADIFLQKLYNQTIFSFKNYKSDRARQRYEGYCANAIRGQRKNSKASRN